MLLKRSCTLFLCTILLLRSTAQPDERGLKKTRDTNVVKGNTYAIIVGITDYKVVPDLQYAHKDARSFERFLLSDAGGKVPAANIETFLNENATRPNVGDAISVLARKAKPGDRIWFFFAGHGDMEDLTQIENGLLLLYNSPNGNYFGMNDDVLEILDLKRYLSPLAQKGVEMIFVVDACHSGNLKGGVEGVQQTASALASAWGKEYKILSCQPNQLSLESAEWGGGRGLFSLQLEEGIKGLADMDNNGIVSMFELQSYIQSNVAKYSEGKQIPMVTGDLSKPIAAVNPVVLAALKKEKAENYPMLAIAKTKGSEEKYIDSLDEAGKKIYASFKKNIEAKQLVWPKDTNALRDYRQLTRRYPDNPVIPTLRRNLATALNDRFNAIVTPLLQGKTSYSSRDECYYAAMELDSCLQLLGEQHYMYPNLKARKLFMDAMSTTWALTETEYNIGLKPILEESIALLEQSEKLEPNAAYTLQALGVRYTFLFEYDKANLAFQKYLDLRPNDFYSKYSLALIYDKLKQYDKSEALFEKLIQQEPKILELYSRLAVVYFNNNKRKESLACTQKIIDTLGDKANGYFYKGLYYSRMNQVDSAVHYYNLTKKEYADCPICDNNIGYIYFVNSQTDSAKRYLNMLVRRDSTDAFANFNLGTIDVIEGNIYDAVHRFIITIDHASAMTDGYVTNMQLYFQKTYPGADKPSMKEFRDKSFIFNLQYLSYLSILYCYLHDSALVKKKDKIELLFERLRNYKEHEVFTWYHHACYMAMKNDTAAALESLEKSLKLGYGTYFTLQYDADLASIRNFPQFRNLIKKYFPDK